MIREYGEYRSLRTRVILAEADAGYADATGNLRLHRDVPAVFIEIAGESTDPWRERRPLHSLKGPAAGRQVVRDSWNLGAGASATATYACVPTWLTDFRGDLARIDVPTLVLHGDDDRILPIMASALPTHEAVKGSKLVVLDGAPHGMLWTHADDVSRALLDFLT